MMKSRQQNEHGEKKSNVRVARDGNFQNLMVEDLVAMDVEGKSIVLA